MFFSLFYKGGDIISLNSKKKRISEIIPSNHEPILETEERSIFSVCKKIRECFDKNDPIGIVEPLIMFSDFIRRSENLLSISGIQEFNIPDILFAIFYEKKELYNESRIASIACLVNISSHQEAAFLFDSENICSKIVYSVRSEKIQETLEKLLFLIQNILYFKNLQVCNFLLQNHIIETITDIAHRSSYQNIIEACFDIMILLCQNPLRHEYVMLTYQMISVFLSSSSLLIEKFVTIFYYLLISDSLDFQVFVENNYTSLVNVGISDRLNFTARVSCNVVRIFVEKYKCYNYFDLKALLNIVVSKIGNPEANDVKRGDQNDAAGNETSIEEIIFSAANAVRVILENSNLTKNFLNENAYLALLHVTLNGSVIVKFAIAGILNCIVNEIDSNSFYLIFLNAGQQSIFNLLADLVDTDDDESIILSIKMLIIIFEKSLSINEKEHCKIMFQEAFNVEFINSCQSKENLEIIQLISVLTKNIF